MSFRFFWYTVCTEFPPCRVYGVKSAAKIEHGRLNYFQTLKRVLLTSSNQRHKGIYDVKLNDPVKCHFKACENYVNDY